MSLTSDDPAGPRCSFCNKGHREVERVIAGPGVYICSECVTLCNDIIQEAPVRSSFGLGSGRTPRPDEIHEFLDQYGKTARKSLRSRLLTWLATQPRQPRPFMC